MTKRTSLGLLTALVLAVSMHAMLGAQQAGSNVNVLPAYPPGNTSPPFSHPGIDDTDELAGDGYLQRQVEPVVAASSLNPDHLVAAFGDFRTVDIGNDQGVPGVGVGAAAEGWIGYSRSYDRGKRWYGAMVPGFPGGTSQADTSSPLYGLTTGSDPVIATTPGGHFYIGGLFFTRGRLSNIAVMHLRDVPSLDGGDSIQPGKISIVDRGSNSSDGNFEDKPAMMGDIARRTTDPSACGPVYMVYTIFTGGTTGAFTSKVGFARSKQGKCGEAWDNPQYLNKNYKQNQGTAIAIDPNTGKIYVIWRHFFVPGGDGFPDSILMSTSTDFGNSFSPPVAITTPSFKPFDQYTISTTACTQATPPIPAEACPVASRSPAFPAITVDGNGNVYVAIQEQILIPVPGKPGYTEPRITLRTSRDGGKTWTVPASLVEAGPGPGSQQVMPALSFGGGLLKAMWYDYRRPEWANPSDGRWQRLSAPIVGVAPPCTNTTPCWYMVGLDRQMETRIAQSVAGEYTTGNPVFSASAPVSNYLLKGRYPATSDTQQTPATSAVNRPNLPMYAAGTTAFTGDYITLNPAWQFERNQGAGNPFRFTTHPLDYMAMSSLAVWTDTRDVAAPNGNVFDIGPSGWPNYGPVGTGAASCINPGARNQNIFFSEVKPGVIAASPATSRQLVDSIGKPFERAFPLYVQNATPTTAPDGTIVPRYFRLTFQADSPTTVLGSFVQGKFANPNNLEAGVTSVDAGILPYSTSSKTIYVYCPGCTSASAFAPFSVKVDEIDSPGAPSLKTNGLKAIVRFNNDPTAPFVTNVDLGTKEIHDVSVSTPQYSDPQYSDPQYSDPQYSDPQYSDPQYSDPQYSDPQYSDMQPVGDFVWTAQDVGNNASSYNARVNLSPTVLASLGGDKKYRLFITRAYNRPGFSLNSCDSRPLPKDQIISVIPLDFSDPQYSDPQYSDPQYSDPQYSDASFATVPPPAGGTALSTASVTTMAATSSLAATTPLRSSGDAPIEHDKIFIVVRVYGPAGSQSLNQAQVEQVLDNASATVTPQAGNTESNGNGGTIITPPVPTSDKAFTTTTLTSDLPTAGQGLAVTFTAHVEPQGDDPLTGSVAFREVDADGNEISVLADVPINADGNATFSKSDFSIGTHYVNAIFSGNADYNGSLSNTLTETITAPTLLFYGPALAPVTETNAVNEATLAESLGYTVVVKNENEAVQEWSVMSQTADFARYNAIVFADPQCATSPGPLQAAEANRTIWSAAATGPKVVIGTDPYYHFYNFPPSNPGSVEDAKTLVRNAIRFAASGTSTGMYMSLSCYYHDAAADTSVPVLDQFASGGVGFKVNGGDLQNIQVLDPGHAVIVGSPETADDDLNDDRLSNWTNSMHEWFSVDGNGNGAGVGFPATWYAIAREITGEASRPYIIVYPLPPPAPIGPF